jgi:hypothetical protein
MDWPHLEMVRSIRHHSILDPFERIIEHDEPPITHPRHGNNYGTCPDAPEVVKWARLHPSKARIPLTYASSKYAASRLRFFRRMHRWMYYTDRVFTALILAKYECTLQDLDKTKVTFPLRCGALPGILPSNRLPACPLSLGLPEMAACDVGRFARSHSLHNKNLSLAVLD